MAVTPAVVALDAAGIAYTIHEYERGEDLRDFGREAAVALGLDHDQVFKTLVVVADEELVVAIVPVSCQLSMKRVAAAVGAKKAVMCEPARAERSSGYIVGGISPIGQRRPLRTVVDESAELFDVVYVSGGRRGMDIGLAPSDLVSVLDAVVAPITAPLTGPNTGPKPAESARRVAHQRFDAGHAVRAGGCDAPSLALQPIGRPPDPPARS